MISGLDSEELDFITTLSNDVIGDGLIDQWHGMTELQVSEIEKLLSNNTYPELDESITNRMREIEESQLNSNTKKQTQQNVNQFKQFLEEQNLSPKIEEMPVRYLAQYLRFWYSQLKKKDNGLYSPSSLICIRASIQRYLSSSEVGRRVNIVNGEDFKEANNMLKCKIGQHLKANGSSSNSSVSINGEDLKKLGHYFNRSDATRLQEEVFFNFLYHFGYRGREWIRDIKVSSIRIHQDQNNVEFVEIMKPKAEKNVKASLSRRNYESNKNVGMYELPDKSKCPVHALKIYLEKLPGDNLFPKPSKDSWYSPNQVQGKHTLHNFMKKISTNAQLSQTYNNHCVRATVVTELHNKGYAVEHIQAVTGHKRPESVYRYLKSISSEKKRKISNAITTTMHTAAKTTEIRSDEKGHGAIVIQEASTSTSSELQPSAVLEKNGAVLKFYL